MQRRRSTGRRGRTAAAGAAAASVPRWHRPRRRPGEPVPYRVPIGHRRTVRGESVLGGASASQKVPSRAARLGRKFAEAAGPPWRVFAGEWGFSPAEELVPLLPEVGPIHAAAGRRAGEGSDHTNRSHPPASGEGTGEGRRRGRAARAPAAWDAHRRRQGLVQARARGRIDVKQPLRRGMAAHGAQRGPRSPGGARSLLAVAAAALLTVPAVAAAASLDGPGGAAMQAPAASVSAHGARASAGAGEQEPSARALQTGGGGGARGFSHRLHRTVECTACHVSGSSHGALKVRTREDCMACHHSRTRATGCTTCHRAGSLPGATTRRVQVRTSVAPGSSPRTLPFAHAFHTTVACRECHGGAPDFRPVADCTGCHARHHTSERDCQRCHRAEDVKGHPAAVHGGCGGAGCHGDPAVLSLSWSRTVCSSCHRDQVGHQPGRDCATCHQVPALHQNGKEVAR